MAFMSSLHMAWRFFNSLFTGQCSLCDVNIEKPFKPNLMDRDRLKSFQNIFPCGADL